MHLHDIVQEQDPPLTTLQVYHRRLKIPKEITHIVSIFTDPWEERASQYFVEKYLQELNDPGIAGMVRQELIDAHVLLDAAIRYPHQL